MTDATSRYGLTAIPEPFRDEALGRTWSEAFWRRRQFARGLRAGFDLGTRYGRMAEREERTKVPWDVASASCSCGWKGEVFYGPNAGKNALADARDHRNHQCRAVKVADTRVLLGQEHEVYG